MTGEEKELLKKYLTEQNLLGPDGSYPHIEAWYQEVRYAQGPHATRTSWTPPGCSAGCRDQPQNIHEKRGNQFFY